MEHAAQLLVQALVLSKLEGCNLLLAELPKCAINPRLTRTKQQDLFSISLIKPTHHTSLYLSIACGSHFLDTNAYIKNSHGLHTLLLPFTLTSVNPLQRPVVSTWVAGHHYITKVHKSLSRMFSFTDPCWWNLPDSIQTVKCLTIFKKQLKTHLFCEHLMASCWFKKKKKKKQNLFFYAFTIPILLFLGCTTVWIFVLLALLVVLPHKSLVNLL